MLSVEVVGGADAGAVVTQLRSLDEAGLLRVTTRPRWAEHATPVALVVAAPSVVGARSEAEVLQQVDVVLRADEPLDEQVTRLWTARLYPYAAGLAGRPDAGGPAVLHPHDQRWPAAADRRLRRLRVALTPAEGSADFRFDHIGSTVIPGLSAKPTLDLQVLVPHLDYTLRFDALLHRVGYRPAVGSRPDSPGVHRDLPRGGEQVPDAVWEKRLFCSRDPVQPSILHIRQAASPWGRYPVLFRDWLRAHPVERDRYQRLKLAVAAEHADDADYDDYTRAKTAYFDRVQPEIDRPAATSAQP
ncbi:hypothetical protein BH20ACT5_BH20ACT5_02450 [soil metagenome]